MGNKNSKALQAMNTKPGKILAEEKFQFVLKLFLQEYKSGEIQEAYCAKFGDSDRNCRYILKNVKQSITEANIEDRDYLVKKTLMQYSDLYHKLYEQGKFVEAGNVLDKQAKLLGLDAPKRTIQEVVNTQTKDVTHLTFDQMKTILGLINSGKTTDISDAEVVN